MGTRTRSDYAKAEATYRGVVVFYETTITEAQAFRELERYAKKPWAYFGNLDNILMLRVRDGGQIVKFLKQPRGEMETIYEGWAYYKEQRMRKFVDEDGDW